MIRPQQEFTRNSLERLSDSDLMFLIRTFADQRSDHENVRDLIGDDQDVLGMMVESDRVFERVIGQSSKVLNISPFFFFGLLIRRTLRDVREQPDLVESTVEELNRSEPDLPWNSRRAEDLLSDPAITDYLANMIAAFTRTSRLFKISQEDENSYYYLVDLVQDSQECDPERRFWIYCHIGNYTLFMTGLFPEFIEHRHTYRRRPVDENFYVSFGKTYYGLAGDHQLARQAELDTVFQKLSSGYELIKVSLNHMTKNYLRA